MAATVAGRISKRRKLETKAETLPHVGSPGKAFVWGDGSMGQLGLGEEVDEKYRPFPIDVFGKKVAQIACGGMHTLALTADGKVYSWGVNDEGALGREAHRDHAASERNPGLVSIPEGERIVQVTAGDSHSVALGESGTAYAWGSFRDSGGVMGFETEVRIQREPVKIDTEERFIMIASGADHVAAIADTGHVFTWGCGDQGQLGRTGVRHSERMGLRLPKYLVPQPVANALDGRKFAATGTAVLVACGSYSTFAVTESGNVFAWGLNNYGQLGLSLTESNMVGLPTKVPSLCGKNIVSIASGQHHTLALTATGDLYSFGRGTYGRLGRGSEISGSDDPHPVPQKVEGLPLDAKAIRVSAGLACSGVILDNGNAWLWGCNTSYQLGKGEDDEDDDIPSKLRETKTTGRMMVQHIAFGGQHSALVMVPKEEHS